jgi:hypothetical protein
LIEFLVAWGWTAPTAAGLGVVGYAGATTGRRRARRLAVDAARLEEQAAVRALVSAQADARSARAELARTQAARGRWVFDSPEVAQARRHLQRARDSLRAARLALRAARGQVQAERTRVRAIASPDELPLLQVVRRHDAVVSRWLEYETDVESALAFPQMTDPQHPQTAAFLVVMQEAQHRRPPTGALRMAPTDFLAYRDAVRRLEEAFTVAEDAALRTSAQRPAMPSSQPLDTPRAQAPRPEVSREAPSPGPDAPQRPVWPVPRRDPGPPSR